MKKALLLSVLVLLLCMAFTALAGTLPEDGSALKEAKTFDRQLEILNNIAREHAEELENGGWDVSLNVSAAPGLPEKLIPDSFDEYGYQNAASFPEELRGHKFIALYSGRGTAVNFAGDWLARFPRDMQAQSLSEAEYALIVEGFWTPSGYEYIPPASSSHRDYYALVLNLQTGKATRFWSHRNNAKTSGKWGQLDGDNLSDAEIWNYLRSEIWGEIRQEAPDGTLLIFGITGRNCYLKGCEGEPVSVEVPAVAADYPVLEIGKECFYGCRTLKSVCLPEGIKRISDSAFYNCDSLEDINLPSTLEVIGNEAFRYCACLKNVTFPDGIKSIGELAFYEDNMLTEVVLPASLTDMGNKAFMYCSRLSRVVMNHAVSFREEDLFKSDSRLNCIYVAGGENNSAALAGIPSYTVVYAPEGSYFLQWARESGRRAVACESPADMPPVEYVTENGMEFLLFEGEAALSAYLGEEAAVTVPETVKGYPVTRILSQAIYRLEQVTSITIPSGIKEIIGSAIYGPDKNVPLDVYIANPEITIGENSIGRYGSNETPVTIHAPEGSTAQRYVNDTTGEPVAFEPWGEGVNPDARVLKNAAVLAGQVQQAVSDFWTTCDQKEYSWLARIPGYEIDKPEAAAVLRLTKEQFDALTLLMTGAENTARVFSLIVNTQWNLPYARAAMQTARGEQFKAAPDGFCAVALLAYRTDLVLVTLDVDGNGQAALLCSSPSIIKEMTPEYITVIAARYGVSGECSVYSGEEAAALLAK